MTPRLLTHRENGNIKNVINEKIKKVIVLCIQKCLFMQSAVCIYVFPCNQDLHIELLVFFRITE